MLNNCKTAAVFPALAFFSLVALGAAPAAAIDNPFRALTGEPVSISLPAHSQTEEGGWYVAIALDLADGWKTYWRAPGPFGVPPQLALVRSDNLARHELHLPEPQLVKDPNGDFAGYKTDTDFLLELEPVDASQPVSAEFVFTFAVCAEVCVPEREVLGVSLNPGEARNVLRVAGLSARLPREGQVVERIVWQEDGLLVTTAEPGENLLVESMENGLVLSLPQQMADGNYRFRATAGALEPGVDIRFTLLNGLGGLTEVRPLAAGTE